MAPSKPWVEVWTRPGAANYRKKIADLPVVEASVQVPYSGVGKGSMSVPSDYDRLDEILYVEPVDGVGSVWSTIKVFDDTGWLYEWLPIPLTPNDGSKSGTSIEIAGDGLEAIWGFARVEPWDWDGSASFVSTFPDWIWGGKNLLSNPGFEESGEQPIIDELWFTGPDPDNPDDGIGGTFVLSDGIGHITVAIPWDATPSQVEARMEEAGIYDDVLVGGEGTESDPWQIEAVVPFREVDLFIDDSGLTPAGTTSHIRRVQFGALEPSGWTKSTTVSSGVPRVFGMYDSWRVVTDQAHSGEYSLRIDPGLVEGSSTRYAGAQQVIRVKPGGIYQAKVWVYPTTAWDTYRFVIRGIDGDFIKSWPGGLTSSVLTPGQWNELVIDDVLVGTNTAVIFRIATTTGGGFDPGVFYVDDGEFNEGMKPTTVGCMLQELYNDAVFYHAPGRVVWEKGDVPTAPYLDLDFSCTVDSNGVAWDRPEVNQTFNPRMSYLQVLDQIVEEGAYDWRVVPADVEAGTYVLQVYNPGALGLGEVTEAGIVGGSSDTQRQAKFFAPDATEIVAEGDENMFERAITPGLVQAFGRIEGSILDQNWVTPGSIWSAARMALDERMRGGESIVYTLASPAQRPLVAYRPGDRIRVHDPPIVDEYRRVQQIQLSISKEQGDQFVVHISDAIPFRLLGGAGPKVTRGLHGQAATDNAVAALLKVFKKAHRDPGPDLRIVGGGGQMTVTVAASNATDQSKGKADLHCTGVNDDQVIQQAFDMLGGRGGKVVLSEGRFHFGLAGVITPPVPFHCHGMGQGATELFADTLGTPYFFLNGINVGEAEHQMYSDMALNGSDKAVVGITSAQASNNSVKVENLIIHDFTSHGVSLPRPAGSWKFRRCFFYANGGNGFFSREAGVDFVDCIFQSNATGGIGIQQDGNGHIRGCLFWSNGGTAIASGNAISQGFGNFIITENIFLTNTGWAINIQDGDENLIANNIFEGNTSGSISFGAGAFGVSTNNLVMGNIQAGAGTFVTVASGSSAHTVMNVINGVLDAGAGADFLGTTTSTFHQGGVLGTGAGSFKLPWTTAGTITGVRAAVGVAPAGAAIIVDVNKNGTSIFSSSVNQPTVPAGSTVGAEATTIASPALVSGDYLTVDIDQIGSTTPGEDLTVVVEWKVTA